MNGGWSPHTHTGQAAYLRSDADATTYMRQKKTSAKTLTVNVILIRIISFGCFPLGIGRWPQNLTFCPHSPQSHLKTWNYMMPDPNEAHTTKPLSVQRFTFLLFIWCFFVVVVVLLVVYLVVVIVVVAVGCLLFSPYSTRVFIFIAKLCAAAPIIIRRKWQWFNDDECFHFAPCALCVVHWNVSAWCCAVYSVCVLSASYLHRVHYSHIFTRTAWSDCWRHSILCAPRLTPVYFCFFSSVLLPLSWMS